MNLFQRNSVPEAYMYIRVSNNLVFPVPISFWEVTKDHHCSPDFNITLECTRDDASSSLSIRNPHGDRVVLACIVPSAFSDRYTLELCRSSRVVLRINQPTTADAGMWICQQTGSTQASIHVDTSK